MDFSRATTYVHSTITGFSVPMSERPREQPELGWRYAFSFVDTFCGEMLPREGYSLWVFAAWSSLWSGNYGFKRFSVLRYGRTYGHLAREESFWVLWYITQDKREGMLFNLVKPCPPFYSFFLEDMVTSEEFLLLLPRPWLSLDSSCLWRN